MPPSLTIPSLAADEIHVWMVPTDAAAGDADALVISLSPHEQHRAARMRQADARRDFIVGRARVRQILGRYVDQPEPDIDVVTRIDGRPRLAGAPGWFDFSFTRCAGLHACAIGRDRRIGIDVESLAGDRDVAAIAATYASAAEADWIRGLPAADQAAAVAALWTKKEAFVKAVGPALQLPLQAFSVPAAADGAVDVPLDHREVSWTVRAFEAGRGVAGAVAAEGAWRLTLLAYPL